MRVSAIVAVGPQGEIGYAGNMAWDYPSEYQFFIQTVSGHHIVMGRTNWVSNISNTKLLSRVTSLVITTDSNLLKFHQIKAQQDVNSFSCLKTAIQFAQSRSETELFIIGGAKLYSSGLSFIERIYYSRVPYIGLADTFFPTNILDKFKLSSQQDFQATADSPPWTLEIYDRKIN